MRTRDIVRQMQPDNVFSEKISVKSEGLRLGNCDKKRKRAESRRRAQAVNDTFHESIPTLT